MHCCHCSPVAFHSYTQCCILAIATFQFVNFWRRFYFRHQQQVHSLCRVECLRRVREEGGALLLTQLNPTSLWLFYSPAPHQPQHAPSTSFLLGYHSIGNDNSISLSDCQFWPLDGFEIPSPKEISVFTRRGLCVGWGLGIRGRALSEKWAFWLKTFIESQ